MPAPNLVRHKAAQEGGAKIGEESASQLAASSVFMAGVAVHAVIHVARDTAVVLICCGGTVAARALEDGVIGGVRVAGGADTVCTAMVDREECVITRWQCRRNPGYCGVARITGGRPTRADVIGIGGSIESCCMARVTGSRRACKHIIDVALIAINSCVRAREREWSAVVVECRTRPRSRVMAGVAGGGKTRRCMIRILGAIPIRLVTAVARRR